MAAPYRAAIIATLCVLLWFTEWVPVWVPTVILWIATPLLLGRHGPEFQPREVLAWSADPILILFLGGFSLAAAARRQGSGSACRLPYAQGLTIGFVEWMIFGVPLTFGLLLLCVGAMVIWLRPSGAIPVMSTGESRPPGRLVALAFVFGATVILWLAFRSMPLHLRCVCWASTS